MVSVDFVKSGDLWEIQWNDTPVEMAIPEARLATYLQEKMMTMYLSSTALPYLFACRLGREKRQGCHYASNRRIR